MRLSAPSLDTAVWSLVAIFAALLLFSEVSIRVRAIGDLISGTMPQKTQALPADPSDNPKGAK